MKKITEQEFDKRFNLVTVPDEADENAGTQCWEMGQIQELLPGVEANHIWSWVDSNGGEYLIAGVHIVDVYGFGVTKETHEFDITMKVDSVRALMPRREENE